MLAVGMLAIWFGYSTGLWGWCLLRDYNITMAALVNPVHPYAGKWPPAKLDNTVIWPGGRTPAAAGSTGSGGSGGFVPPENVIPAPKSGKCPPGYVTHPVNGRCVPIIASGPPAV